MPDSDDQDENAYLSARDMRLWAEQEIKDASKALELRLREATSLAAAYSAGDINAEKADELQSRYYHRWGEALPGIRLRIL